MRGYLTDHRDLIFGHFPRNVSGQKCGYSISIYWCTRIFNARFSRSSSSSAGAVLGAPNPLGFILLAPTFLRSIGLRAVEGADRGNLELGPLDHGYLPYSDPKRCRKGRRAIQVHVKQLDRSQHLRRLPLRWGHDHDQRPGDVDRTVERDQRRRGRLAALPTAQEERPRRRAAEQISLPPVGRDPQSVANSTGSRFRARSRPISTGAAG
jgi:hypothetical protein